MQNTLSLFFEINNLDTYQNHEVIELKASAEFTDEEIMQYIKTSLLRLLIELEKPENAHPTTPTVTCTEETVSDDTDMN